MTTKAARRQCQCPCTMMGQAELHRCTGHRDLEPRLDCYFEQGATRVAIHPCAACRSANLRILVTGSRDADYDTYVDRVFAVLDMELANLAVYAHLGITVSPIIVQGGAQGVDAMAVQWAKDHGHMTETHYPEYNRYGRRKAPHIRNARMVSLGARLCIGVIVHPGSNGTITTLEKAGKATIETHTHDWSDET